MLLTGCAAPEEKISFLPFPEGSPVVEDVTPHGEYLTAAPLPFSVYKGAFIVDYADAAIIEIKVR